ncbi:MAG TPA: hypothetical protein VF698_07285 [Thermoanaerobaculia bacterium]|jgi:lysylphosphatidylglycerol synthetase-like protein (DUF2156 family)
MAKAKGRGITDAQLRSHIGLFWVGAQLAVLGTIFVCYQLGGFEFDELTTLLAVVLPLFAGVSIVVVRFFAQNRHSIARGQPVTGTYVALVWLFAVALAVTVVWVIVGRATNRVFDTFDQAKLFLAGLEVVYVVYIAQLLAPLFGVKPEEMRQREPRTGGEAP